jgi:NADH-ubiquinone oxidoreductase chain 5
MKSALSAILLNRVGDSFFVLAIIVIFSLFGSINIESITTLVPFVNTNLLLFSSFCLFLGAVAKSTQFGLHC